MADVLDAPTSDRHRQVNQKPRLRIIDCDIHPSPRSNEEVIEFMPQRWQRHYAEYGDHLRIPFIVNLPYPRSAPRIARRDAWPPGGGVPGSDLDFMRQQYLDPHDVEFGLLQVLDLFIYSQQNLEFGAALASAINDWQYECVSRLEPRLKPSIVLGQDNPDAAVAEIERCAATGRYCQINIAPRASEPLGRRKYWPIYEAAEAAGLPIGLHTGGYGGHPPTGGGWPSYYNEEHHSNVHTMATVLTSLVIEGVPERFPKLKFVFIESGFGFVPAATWRMDKHFERFRSEVPHLKRKPSEYVRQHFWFATQPVEEPEQARHMRTVLDWIGIDRILFSSDYPHWDFDDPGHTFKIPLSDAERTKIFNTNARAVYKLE